MKSFIRENPLIVASIALPTVVLALFAAATIIPSWLTAPTTYDLVMTRGMRNLRTLPIRVDLTVTDGRVRAQLIKGPEYSGGMVPRVFIFSAETQEVREVSIPIPSDISALRTGDELPIPELADLRLDTTARSPDGWELEGADYSRGGGIFTSLFGGGSGRYEARLIKDGAVMRMRFPGDSRPYYAGRAMFLGWVME